jgi:Protein of unknown function (DUF3096)
MVFYTISVARASRSSGSTVAMPRRWRFCSQRPLVGATFSVIFGGRGETRGIERAFSIHRKQKAYSMTIDIVAIQPLVALIAGILILLVPRLLNYVVAIYLILIGLIGLWPHIAYHGPH